MRSLRAVESEQVISTLLTEQPDYKLPPLLSATLAKRSPEQNQELLANLLQVRPAALRPAAKLQPWPKARRPPCFKARP